ncbi:MAG: TMEM165/GDT1 family protein [Deltaproteobacteria bacterium]
MDIAVAVQHGVPDHLHRGAARQDPVAALVLATRHKPAPVFLGASLALSVQSAIAVLAGSLFVSCRLVRHDAEKFIIDRELGRTDHNVLPMAIVDARDAPRCTCKRSADTSAMAVR